MFAHRYKTEATSSGIIHDSKVHGVNMGHIWGRQDPGGPHVDPMNFAIWDVSFADESIVSLYNCNGHARAFRCVVERLMNCCKKQIKFSSTKTRVLEADPGFIIEYRMRPVLMVPVLGPVCQHAGGSSDDQESFWDIGLNVWTPSCS